jgi:predicted regulator of Ras-like GTPase activity (Roadblock/LC7/MglB family)
VSDTDRRIDSGLFAIELDAEGPFSSILRELVARVPGAMGAILADAEGEAVDQFAHRPTLEIRLIGAHWGVVLSQIRQHLRPFTGTMREVLIEGERSLTFIRPVDDDYFIVLETTRDAHLGNAFRELDRGVQRCRKEM